MKNNKLISVLLALLVCLSMVVSVSATEEANLIFALESADSSVEELGASVVGAGEEFVVSVNIVKNEGFKNAILYVEFDAEKLELVNVESLDAENVMIYESGKIYIGSTSAWEAGDAYTATGAIAELTFKVLVETDEQLTVELKASQKNVTNAEGKANVVTVSATGLTVNAVSADHVCDVNNTVEANNAVEPTCTEAGKNTDLLCAHCGEVAVEGEEIAALGHAAGEVVVENNVDASCTVAGKYENVTYCTVCEIELTRETVNVDALGHTWGEWNITTAPTCSNFGVQSRSCSACGVVEDDASVPATGEHKYGEWKVTTAATTEAEGEETRTCECGATETRSIAKLPAEPAPKNNTLVIVIIVVVVLAGAGVAAYFVLKNKKK